MMLGVKAKAMRGTPAQHLDSGMRTLRDAANLNGTGRSIELFGYEAVAILQLITDLEAQVTDLESLPDWPS